MLVNDLAAIRWTGHKATVVNGLNTTYMNIIARSVLHLRVACCATGCPK